MRKAPVPPSLIPYYLEHNGSIQRVPVLGSSVGDLFSISTLIEGKILVLKRMGERLKHLPSHDALLLLRHSLAIPKLLYSLRSAPCFLSPCLKTYDVELRRIMGSITNISLDAGSSWIQASLPVREGCLGIQSAVQLAPSAFLVSAAGSSDLAHEILPPHFQASPLPHWDVAISEWSSGHDHLPPTGNDSFLQRAWDAPRVSAVADSLLNSAPDAISRVRLLATSTKESGAWLHALPISSLGLQMDDNAYQSGSRPSYRCTPGGTPPMPSL